MRELRPGAPLVNELGDTPYEQPEARSKAAFEELTIQRIMEACSYLSLGYACRIEAAAADHAHAWSDFAAMVRIELARIRCGERSA